MKGMAVMGRTLGARVQTPLSARCTRGRTKRAGEWAPSGFVRRARGQSPLVLLIALVSAGIVVPAPMAWADTPNGEAPALQLAQATTTVPAAPPGTPPPPAPEEAAEATPPTEPDEDGERPLAEDEAMVLNFERADIREVIHSLATALGLSYTIDPRIEGQVTIRTTGRIARRDLFPLFNEILRNNGIAAVRQGDLYQILPVAEAKTRAIVPRGGVRDAI